MDNLTHSLIGLGVAKAGLEKLSPGATILCMVAANFPDADIVTLVGGRWTYLQHHRGITHSIVGTIALSVLLPLVFYLGDKLIARWRKRDPSVKLRGLLIASLIASATHPFMDWTNNYGVRPLLPWSSQWFYGDLVFIIDPFLWMTLGGAAFLVTAKNKKRIAAWIVIALVPSYLVLFSAASRGPSGSTIFVRGFWLIALVTLIVLYWRKAGEDWGARIPRVALGLVVIYLVGLFVIHEFAFRRAVDQAQVIARSNGENIVEIAAMPTAANPFEWSGVVETEKAAYRFNVSLTGGSGSPSKVIRHPRPETLNANAIDDAVQQRRTRVFLGFARFPVARVVGEDCMTQTLVQFADLRYTEPGSGRGTFALEVPVECPQVRAGQ